MDKQIKIYLDKIIKVIKNDYPLFKNLRDYGFKLSEDELNYVLSNIFQQPVRVEVYGYQTIGIGIYNQNGDMRYFEYPNGLWVKKEYYRK